MENLKPKNKKLFYLLLLLIIILAIFFRFWQLDKIPPGLYPDEAINANDALLNPGKIFYPGNNGREGLFINLIAFSFSIFGISLWSLKLVSALAGILTIFGVYLLTKELFYSRKLALLSSFFLATSFWHINFSRIGFRAILVPLILTFAFYFLFKGFRTKKITNFIFAGLIYGLGFYTYISFRLSVLLLLLILIFFLFSYIKEKQSKKFFLFVIYFLIFAFIVALPIGMYFLQNHQDFISRATGISIFAQENPIKALAVSAIVHLGMFNFLGDPNWRHNFAFSPQLFWPVGILFLIGFAASVKKIIASIKEKKSSQFAAYFLLISWLLIMLLPGILTFEGIPHSLRTIGSIVPAYILAALGGYQLYKFLSKKISRKLLAPISVLFVILIGYYQYNTYFIGWAEKPEVSRAFEKHYTEIGYYLNSLPENLQKYVIVNELGSPLYGISIPGQTIMFIERTKFPKLRAIYIKAEDISQIEINQTTEIIPLYEKGLFEKLQQMFPQGKIIEKDYFKVYRIE